MRPADVQQMSLGDQFDRSQHWFGRVAAAATLLLVAVSAATLMLSLVGLMEPTQLLGSWKTGAAFLDSLQQLHPYWRVPLGVTAAVVGPLALYFAARLLRPETQTSRHVLVADERGFVLVDSQGVEAVAAGAAMRAPGVVDVDVRARGAGSSPVRLEAIVGIHPGASVEAAGLAVREHAREAVERLVGLPVSSVVVDVRVLEADELARGMPV